MQSGFGNAPYGVDEKHFLELAERPTEWEREP
jgi:hypothetical protein